MMWSGKAKTCIHDCNYLVCPSHFQLCKIIIVIAKCAVKKSFSYQKIKQTIKFIVHQTLFSDKTDNVFAHYSFFVTEFKKLYNNQIFTFTLFVSVTFTSLKIKITSSTLRFRLCSHCTG